MQSVATGNEEAISGRLHQLPKEGVDRYIVVIPALAGSGFDESPYRVFGLGLFRCYNYFRADYLTAVFAVHRVIVLDARSGAKLADERVELHAKVASSLWPGDYGEMSPEQIRQVSDKLADLVLRNLPKALKKLNLIQ